MNAAVFTRALATVVAAAALGLVPVAAPAQTYPARPITLIVPFTPGTGPDIIARTLGQRLNERWGQPVVVDNKPGASGSIGSDLVAKAQPNGYTLMVTATVFAILPSLMKNVPYDTIKDFTPVAKLAIGGVSLVVSTKALPAVTSFKEFVALAKSKPGQLNYSSPGTGTLQQLGMELIKQRLGLDIVHVPYRGQSVAITDLAGGQVDSSLLPEHTALPLADGGQLRLLATAGDTRSELSPDIPTFRELGYPELNLELWFGLYAPARLPPEIVKAWDTELAGYLATPELKKSWLHQGLMPSYEPSAQVAARTKEAGEFWGEVARKAGIKPE
jgi:tripartite-type tricarboxylate transporter receptor subunit TctC